MGLHSLTVADSLRELFIFCISIQILDVPDFGVFSFSLIREEIVLWIRKKTGAPTIRLDSIASAKEFLAKHHEFVVGFFRNYEVCCTT